MQQLALRPSTQALQLAEQMLQRADIRETILRETIESARQGQIRESGRTVCGDARHPIGPAARRFTSVSLETCPRQVGGSWHTHITTGELLTPENSLPDIANVVFGIMDVSIVAGAESSDVVVAAEDRRAMQAAFQEALGLDVRGPDDVARRVLDGEIPDPRGARRQVRDRLGELVWTADTAHPALAEAIIALSPDPPAFEAHHPEVAACFMYHLTVRQLLQSGPFDQLRDRGNSIGAGIDRAVDAITGDVELRSEATSTAIGVIVGDLVRRMVFPG